MADIKPSIVLEDSKGNKYLFYYKDYSIYYREVLSSGDTKDTILISQANPDFAATIDTDDAVYVTCNSRYKGVLLFVYTNLGWKFDSVVNINNSSNIYIMDILVQNGSIHIFFAKRLPVANLYNVYHLQKNISEQSAYIEYSWRKNSISEIYSQNIESSFSITTSKGGIIHYANVWYDGALYYINYYSYDDSIKYWIHKTLSISYKNHVAIKLMNQNKKINLLCFSNDNEASNIHHFQSKSAGGSEIDFKEINNAYVDTGGVIPLFYYDDKALQLAWLKDHMLHQYTFDDSAGKWKKTIDLPISPETNMYLLKLIKNTGSISATKGYFLIESNYDITRPIEQVSRQVPEDKPLEKQQTEVVPEVSEYLKQILDEIKGLSDSIQHLNSRIDTLESNTDATKHPIGKSDESLLKAHENTNVDIGSNPLKKTNFKEKFMTHENTNVDIESKTLKKTNFKEKFMKSVKTPNYDSLLINQENITTFVGKPAADKNSKSTAPGSEESIDASGKQAFAAPGPRYQNSSFIKKIGEFFK